MPEEQTKKWYQSKGVWGGFIAVIAGLGSQFGLSISPDVQTQLAQQIPAVVSSLAGVIAIIGRIVADKQVK